MDHFATLLDASVDVTEHPIAKLGRYRDPRYGTFAITKADFEAWRTRLAGEQNGRIPIDYDHAASKGNTKAAGWITDLTLRGNLVMASIEWTPDGAEAVRNKDYLFVSPEFTDRYRDETGKVLGKALLGVALTNRPFLRKGMPAISLSDEQGFATALEVSDAPVRSGDSPTRMPELSNIAKALGLAEDADEQTVVAAITEARTEPEPVKLDEAAAAEGKVLLEQGTVDELRAKAEMGEKALAQLTEQRFEGAFEKALAEGRVDAREETRETYKELFASAPDATLRLLAEAPKVVRTEPTPAEGDVKVSGEFSGSAVDADRAELDARATKLSQDKGISYVEALEQLTGVSL